MSLPAGSATAMSHPFVTNRHSLVLRALNRSRAHPDDSTRPRTAGQLCPSLVPLSKMS
jgi:hypothetical protein